MVIMRANSCRILLLCQLVVVAPSSATNLAECVGIGNDRTRLACYDEVAGKLMEHTVVSISPSPKSSAESEFLFKTERSQSNLAKRWAFEPDDADDLFRLRPYKRIYVLPVSWTNRPNSMPASPTSGHALAGPVDIDHVEAAFQISLKTRLIRNIWNENGDLWFGYTQSARWQVYNHGLSAPFRETNYEPEAMLVFRTDQNILGWHARMLGLSLNHQSNGRSLPLSRSWNRIVGEVGLERGNWVLSLRPWWRIPENASNDDNQDISDYIGRAEVSLSYLRNKHQMTLQARHSLRLGSASRGSLRLGWSFPLYGSLKGYVQLFSGYGESLVDYNHRQTVIGAGISLVDW